MTSDQLSSRIENAFSSGQAKLGLELLREFNQSSKANAGSLNRQAIIEEQIGDQGLAGRAHLACIEAAPHIAVGYLYAGYWLQQQGQTDAAAAVYSLANEADPTLLKPALANSGDLRQIRADAGYRLLRTHLSNHHREFMCDRDARIRDAVWVQTHDGIEAKETDQYAPQLFHIPELSRHPWYPADAFPWVRSIKSSATAIKAELYSVLHEEQAQDLLRPYLSAGEPLPENLKALSDSLNWSALDLYRDGQINEKITDYFPQTLALLNECDTYKLDDSPYEVFFSVLKAGQSISPHYGQSNHALTVHLALEVPDDCYIDVGGQRKNWREGEVLLFDDSYLHSAHNQSDCDRIVMIFSVWHPDLNLSEREAIVDCFKHRASWMAARRAKLRYLAA